MCRAVGLTLFMISLCPLSVRAIVNCSQIPDSGEKPVVRPLEVGALGPLLEPDLNRKFYSNKTPWALREAFFGHLAGRISTSAFDGLLEAYSSKAAITFRVLVSKAEWANLRSRTHRFYPDENPLSLIANYSNEHGLKSSIEAENDQFYVVAFTPKNPTAVSQLTYEALSRLHQTVFSEFVYLEGRPTNMLMAVQESVFQSLSEYARRRLGGALVNPRYGFIQLVRTGRISLDAAKALVDFESEPIFLDLHIPKALLNRRTFQNVRMDLANRFEAIEKHNIISYRIRIGSESDLESLYRQIGDFPGGLTLASFTSIPVLEKP